MNHIERIDSLRRSFTKDYDALLVTNPRNIRYLCGFSGSSGSLLITPSRAVFFTDFRYQEQSAVQVGKAARIVVFTKSLVDSLKKEIKKLKIGRLGIEKSMSLNLFLSYADNLKIDLVPTELLVEELRQYKDADELACLKKAFAIADAAFADLIKVIKPGMRETEVAAHLEFSMKMRGSEMPSFDTIIASGPNSSKPHAQPSSRKIKVGEMVKIDFGAVLGGYHSDMTRTIFLGKATAKFKKVYNTVLKAQTEAVKALKAGIVCNKVDAVARKVITDAGYGEYFGHGLGHSLGLDVHEMPALNKKCKDKAEPGMLFTVEPGIYLPGWGGVRIEDVYMIKPDGLLRLTHTSNSLLELDF
ncbi:MAG: Aminopeptidase YpdF (MP-, MA-, MS-, AP-, NP- specific) [Candidatus Rifleibacterium amylolyticum]|nr:MAG: Aminopeptidase YpdF (MP-, MA-, MS-, AP-, NP- specific) [Candidatus Rifleibacterium amylolyticum]